MISFGVGTVRYYEHKKFANFEYLFVYSCRSVNTTMYEQASDSNDAYS